MTPLHGGAGRAEFVFELIAARGTGPGLGWGILPRAVLGFRDGTSVGWCFIRWCTVYIETGLKWWYPEKRVVSVGTSTITGLDGPSVQSDTSLFHRRRRSGRTMRLWGTAKQVG